ncbi:MAG: hypothetical protein LBS29_04750 [Endomicrobium sp.]|jgi:hypothetical protein|nr:hypothetical protein [Endomicrobium sp.]
MDSGTKYRYFDVCARLERVVTESNLKIKQSLDNKEKVKKIKDAIIVYNDILDKFSFVEKELKQMIEDLTEYVGDKKKESLYTIAQVLLAVGNIVPASSQDIRFKMEDGEAWFETSDRMSLDRVEGSGYRAVLSMFMRNVFLQLNPQYMRVLILDEIFAKLSPERSAVLSTYLGMLGESMQIISIEQKPEVFTNTVCESFNFFIEDNKTTVMKG